MRMCLMHSFTYSWNYTLEYLHFVIHHILYSSLSLSLKYRQLKIHQFITLINPTEFPLQSVMTFYLLTSLFSIVSPQLFHLINQTMPHRFSLITTLQFFHLINPAMPRKLSSRFTISHPLFADYLSALLALALQLTHCWHSS